MKNNLQEDLHACPMSCFHERKAAPTGGTRSNVHCAVPRVDTRQTCTFCALSLRYILSPLKCYCWCLGAAGSDAFPASIACVSLIKLLRCCRGNLFLCRSAQKCLWAGCTWANKLSLEVFWTMFVALMLMGRDLLGIIFLFLFALDWSADIPDSDGSRFERVRNYHFWCQKKNAACHLR